MEVAVSLEDQHVALEIVADGRTHTVRFFIGDSEFALPSGPIRGEFGAAAFGEGKEVEYLRLRDDNGILFEGGSSTIFDGVAGGGSQLDGSVFAAGDSTGNRCAAKEGEATERSVAASLDGEIHLVDTDGLDATVSGVPVRVFGLEAQEVSFADAGSVDGWGPGLHSRVKVRGYLFRLF